MLAPQRAGRFTSKRADPMRETRGTHRVRPREPRRIIFSVATVVFALVFTTVGIWLASLATLGGPVLASNSWWMLTWGTKEVSVGDDVLMSSSPPPTSPVGKWLVSNQETWVGQVVDVSDVDGVVVVQCRPGDCLGSADVVEIPRGMVHGVVTPIFGGDRG